MDPRDPAYAERLRDLIPLGSLPAERQEEVLQQAEICEYAPGQYVFRQGDRDDHALYLLRGQLSLFSDSRVVKRVAEGTEAARYALAHLQPRQYSGRAESLLIVLRVDRHLLARLASTGGRELGATPELYVRDLEAADAGDWMARLLSSNLFERIPAHDLQRIFTAVEPLEASAGEVVVHQGGAGDFYYILVRGRAEVTRRTATGSEIKLAELTDGDSFGEDALVGETTRNATVRMLTDGRLMRLSRANFNDLIRKPALRAVDFSTAEDLAARGAIWLDVRFPDEHKASHIEGSLNIPLNLLRLQAGRLKPDRTYLVYCDTGSRSAVATFLMTQRGLDARLVEGGFLRASTRPTVSAVARPPTAEAPALQTRGREATEEVPTSPSLPERSSSSGLDAAALRRENDRLRGLARQLERRLAEEQTARRTEMVRHRDELGRLRSLIELGEARVKEVREQHAAERKGLEQELERTLAARASDAEDRMHAQVQVTEEAVSAAEQLRIALQGAREEVARAEAARRGDAAHIARLSEELSAVRAEVARVRLALQETEARAEQASRVRDSAATAHQAEVEALTRRAERAETEAGMARARAEQLAAEAAALQETRQALAATLEGERRAHREDIAAVEQGRAEALAALETLREQATREVEAAATRAALADGEASRHAARAADLERATAELGEALERERAAREAERASATERERAHEAETAALRARAEDIAADLASLQARHEALESTLEGERRAHRRALADAEETLAAERAALIVFREETSQESEAISARATRAAEETACHAHRVSDLEAALADAQATLERERSVWRAEHTSATATLREEHNSVVRALRGEQERLRVALADAERRAGDLDATAARHREELSRLRTEIAEAVERAGEAEGALQSERAARQTERVAYEERLSALAADGDAARTAELARLGRQLAEQEERREREAADLTRKIRELGAQRRAAETELEQMHERQAKVEADAAALRVLHERGEAECRRLQADAEEAALRAVRQGELRAQAERALEAEREGRGELARVREGERAAEIDRLAGELERSRAARAEAERRAAALEQRLHETLARLGHPGGLEPPAPEPESSSAQEKALVPRALRESLQRQRAALERAREGGNT
jgi:CRP-like cAMP-binding protein